jgi:hypothetical protein
VPFTFFVAKRCQHIQLNDSPERFLVDYRGYLQADAFRRYDGLYLAPQCSQESPLDIEHQAAENRILGPGGTQRFGLQFEIGHPDARRCHRWQLFGYRARP